MLTELALLATSLIGGGAAYYARTLFWRLHTDALTGLGNRAELYRRFARLSFLARNREPVALLLGDEFAVLITGHGAEHAESRALEITRALSGTRVVDGQPADVAMSWARPRSRSPRTPR